MVKIQLKAGNQVKVITGKFRGLVDNIHSIDRQKERVYLAKAIRKQYEKSPALKKKSQLKEIMVPIHLSNVKLWQTITERKGK